MDRKKKTIVYRILVILLIVILYEGISLFSGIFDLPKLKTADFFSRLKYKLRPVPPALNDIVIIGIDDEAYERFGRKWPWGREVFASLICKLHKYNPKVIGIDLAFVGETFQRKEADKLLAQAFKDVGNVVLASFLSQTGEYIRPYSLFAGSVIGYGFTNKPLDKDSVVRRIKLVSLSGLNTVIDYAFELRVISAFLGLPQKKIQFNKKNSTFFPLMPSLAGIPVDKNGITRLNFLAKADDFKVISVLDVLEDEIEGDLFKDKIVLIGVCGKGFQDFSPTPAGVLPGVVIIANSILMILEQNYIKEFPTLLNLLFLMPFALISGLAFFRFRILKGFIWMLLFVCLFGFVSIVLTINNIWWDFFSTPFIVLFMYPSINFYKYTRLVMEILILKRLVVTDPLTGLYSYKYYQLRLNSDLKMAIRENEPLAIVFFKTNDLNQVTTSLGSEKTDDVIVELAKLLQRYSRKTRGVDLISRYEESEFRVILHNTTKEGAVNYAERICNALRNHDFLGKEKVRIFLSAGISSYPYIGTRSSTALIKCAEYALSRAEGVSGIRVCLYDAGLDTVDLEEGGFDEAAVSETDLGYVATDLEEKNQKLVKAIRKLRSAHEELIKMERVSAMGKITAQIHHELNNPLHNLGSFLETIEKKGRWDSEVREFVSLALKEVNRMRKLSYELRDFYKPVRKEMVDIELNPVLEDMLKMSKKQLEENNIKVVKEFHPDLPRIKGNTEELKQVFLNMIINAVEAMSGGGVLTVGTRICVDKKPSLVEISIKDTGCGIPADNMDKIFQPFFTTKGDMRGTGLGLYASSEIVKKHGGSINVASRAGIDTTFRIYFPAG